MNSKTANAIAALLLAAFLIAVFLRNNTGLLISALAQEKGFLKWGLAVLIWQVFRAFSSGNARTFLDATAGVAVVSALVLGLGKNGQALQSLSSGIHNLLK